MGASRIPDLASFRDLTTDHPVVSLKRIRSYASLRFGKFRARRAAATIFFTCMAFVVPNHILSGPCSFLGGPGIGCEVTGPSTDLTTGSSLSLRSVCQDAAQTAAGLRTLTQSPDALRKKP